MDAKRPKTGGRSRGTPNKATTEVKEALTACFDRLGGVAFLQKWAKENPTEFFKLWVKMLPQQVKGEFTGADGQPLNMAPPVVNVSFVSPDSEAAQ